MAQISSITGTWAIGTNWPYPKLFFTDYFIMAVAVKGDNLALYDMTNAGNVWTATERVDFGVKSGITSVDVAGFDKYAVIVVNKGATKAVYEKNITTGAVTLTAITMIPGGNSCCNYNSQLVIGGLYSTGAPWSTMTTCGVAWSDIGSNIMLPGNAVGTSDLTAGFMKMPWDENGNGQVFKVLTLDNKVVVYGDKGIGTLQSTVVESFPLMAFDHISKVGVISTYAVNGNDKIHGFVDTNYDWNIFTSEGQKTLGYRDYLSALTGEIIVTYEESNNRFYISDGLKCFVFNNVGMYSTNQCVSSIGRYKQVLCGFVKDNLDDKIRVESTPFDLGLQDMKTIESVETGIVYDTVADEILYGKLATRYDYKGDFTTLAYQQLNPRGEFTQKITGREFKLYFQSGYEADATFRLSNVKVKIKQSDKRNTRGRIDVN